MGNARETEADRKPNLPEMDLPVNPPILPMLSKRVADLPTGEEWIYEPKWDGFRTLIFRDGKEVLIQSRDEKSLNRYFPNCSIRCWRNYRIVVFLTEKSLLRRMAHLISM